MIIFKALHRENLQQHALLSYKIYVDDVDVVDF